MNKIFVFVMVLSVIGVGLLPSVTFGYMDCRDSTKGCSVEELLELSKNAPVNNDERIAILQELIKRLTTQLVSLKQVPAVPANSTKGCLDLSTNLVPGTTDAKTGGEVSKLQMFLREQGAYPNGQVTGYYGPLTAEAVMRWQKTKGMDFVTTKSGVGQMTREKMRCRLTATETEDPASIRKISWEIESANPYITNNDDPKKYEQMVILNVTYASTTKGYRLGTAYGSHEETVSTDVTARGKNVLGKASFYYALTGVTFTAYRDSWYENDQYHSRFWVERHEDDASGRTSGKTTIVLEIP